MFSILRKKPSSIDNVRSLSFVGEDDSRAALQMNLSSCRIIQFFSAHAVLSKDYQHC